MEIIKLSNTTSTNEYLKQMLDRQPNAMQWEGVVVTAYQASGKGMGSNTWESEAGKNLLFSILIHPTWLQPSMQFLLSMAQALAIYDVLSQYTEGITIKWPNDIYWHDRKISGTLIDGTIKGHQMCDMIIGTGININQEVFLSDAPNPVSLLQITGKEHDPYDILKKIIKCFEHYYGIALREWTASQECNTIIATYHQHLYRKDELHWYEDTEGRFQAILLYVQPNGIMTLKRTDGTLSQYEFKEVKFI